MQYRFQIDFKDGLNKHKEDGTGGYLVLQESTTRTGKGYKM